MTEKLIYFYISLNGTVLLIYGIDKFKAIHHQWRIRESHLILTTLLGPFGALFGMLLFRHKIRKLKFIISIPLILVIHVFVCFYFYASY